MHHATLPSARDLAEMEDYALNVGVDLELSLDQEGNTPIIWLGRIERAGGLPGSGRRVLNRLGELADEIGIAIRAAVTWWNSALLDYYADFGFEVIEQPLLNEEGDLAVIERAPRWS